METSNDPFCHSVYYLRANASFDDSRGRYWAYSFYDAAGNPVLEARFPEIPKEVRLFAPGRPDTTLLRLKAWRWFWWNGRYDVLEAGTGNVLATLRRMGGIEGPDRRRIGRVKDPTPAKRYFLQLFFIGALNMLFGQSDDPSTLSVDEYRLEAGGREIGLLRRAKLPFLRQSNPDALQSKTGWRRWLGRLRLSIRKRFEGGGWLLDFSADTNRLLDSRVRIAAALFRIQIESRYR